MTDAVPMKDDGERFQDFEAFWPFYLREHSRPSTRTMHFIGTTIGFLCLVATVATVIIRPGPLGLAWIPIGLVAGYAFAWISHALLEKNKPATFTYPLWSFAADWKMWGLTIRGKLTGELDAAGVR